MKEKVTIAKKDTALARVIPIVNKCKRRSGMKSLKRILSAIILGGLIFVIGCATTGKGGGERAQLKEPRIKPLGESAWTADQQKLIIKYKMPDGHFPNILTTLANHPKFLDKYLVMADYIAKESTLPPREREILILRTGWLCRSEFEMGWHTLIGKSAGLTNEEIKRIAKGPKAVGWNSFEATLILAADELYYNTFITDATWNALAKRYNQQQLMDLVFTAGQYNFIAMFLNSFGVQLDEGVPKFPGKDDK
jgi:4-carboxymuconolactone decarboxylase